MDENGIITQQAEEEKICLSHGRKRWFYLFSDFKVEDDLLIKGKREYCKAVKSAAKKSSRKKVST